MHRGRYSKYIRPFNILVDILSIFLLYPLFYKGFNIDLKYFGVYLVGVWLISSVITKFYDIYRFTTPVEILTKTFKQFILFFLLILAVFPFYKTAIFSGAATGKFLLVLFCIVLVQKTFEFYYLKKYRILTGNNFRKVIIVGYSEEARNLQKVFEQRSDYGYKFQGFFSDKKSREENVKGKINDLFDFVIQEQIDEIYCSIGELSNENQKKLIDFADENSLTLKFIPGKKIIFSKKLRTDYYELFPVLSIQKSPLDNYYIELFKRIFDIVFSLFIIIFVLSWLTPLLGLLIKLESKGPIFFKQSRPGLNEEEFFCFKFRSMQLNETTEKEASRNDPRVTKIGKFIRKTSIDEIPQFFNVLLGDMSVVGPRPHLWAQNQNYGNRIKKYMVRHHVKPGVTGLAQVKGFRGEIETDEDMANRIKYDVFYIENWSIFMDIKIIIQTVVNIFKGEEKAY